MASGDDEAVAGFETLATLTRSPVRLRVLEHLLERGAGTASDIAPHVDASRRTVSRSLSALDEQRLATSKGQTYRVTTYAELVADDIFSLLERLERGHEFATFLEVFPTEEFGFTASDIATVDGTTTCRRSADPHAPVSHVIDALDDTRRVRVLAPIASPLYVRPLVARVRDGATVDAVVDADAYNSFCSKLRGGVRVAATLADVSLAVHDDVSFGLLECDKRVVLGAYDDGVLQATFETDDEGVRDASRDVYDRYRTAANRVVD
ncbi:helix-turn-helix transcriptional regulator [Natronobacterium gregoryi]|uniref:Bacterial regulatory protein, arsR family n=2 Tax=Natronobacterium gregoryi TaxID=44930 RepID=L0AKF1_NATGS|nr:winged helix-turn-helix domain-containing protein [Natronobacterium gregoryi]AFZ74378.1 Bacterial regulatory protein, arsR family [Natronobacterium gregoryi SP2]ELY74125.1 transcriptional regulator [Natronobacterium gregoryi SP2]PLK22112.1 transcriptional regulator [Natronobacterium gregoryi SP2]SFJ61277.1 Predicted transcriptional regulator, contains HTH domain [Natronobacterium gregoryi]